MVSLEGKREVKCRFIDKVQVEKSHFNESKKEEKHSPNGRDDFIRLSAGQEVKQHAPLGV